MGWFLYAGGFRFAMSYSSVLISFVILLSGLLSELPADARDTRGVKLKEKDEAAYSSGGSRIALVIGNSRYKDSPLKNPLNDASDIAASLREIGFSVTLKPDAGQEEMERSIDAFTRMIRKGVTALFYFAGHGVQVEGRNFLIPVGRDIQSEVEVKSRSVEVGELLEKMERRGGSTTIIILDACRNNPFARSFRSAQRGLASITAPKNSIIIYATAPGQTAADGDGRNGVFTKHLLKELKSPDVDIEQMLRRVRLGVQKETGGKQDPFTTSNLTVEHLPLNPVTGVHRPASQEPLNDSPTPADPVQQSTASRDSAAMIDGVEVREVIHPDGILAIQLVAFGSNDSADPVVWRATAKKEAEKKIKKALEAKLTQPPFGLAREVIGRIHEQGKLLEVDFRDNEKSVSMTYEVTMKIKRGK